MPAVTALKGKLEARPYNGPSAFVAASFQLAILEFRVSMSLEAREASRRTSRCTEKRPRPRRSSNPEETPTRSSDSLAQGDRYCRPRNRASRLCDEIKN